MNLQRLHDILSLKRGHNSVGERMLCDMLVSYGMDALRDPGTGEPLGYFMTIGDSRTLFTAHTDTAHYSEPGSDDTRNAYIPMFDETMLYALDAPLGADDGAGVWLLLEMIDARVPGAYLFARGEERCGIGSRGIAQHHAHWLKQFDRCVSFDRWGTHSVITHQSGIRCCSDEFAEALASALTDDAYFYAPDNTGIFTDSANFTGTIAECTNVSVGYYDEHSTRERLDLNYLLSLRYRCIDLDWESLPTVRTPGDFEYEDYGWCALYRSAINDSDDNDSVDKPVEHALALLSNASYSDIVRYVRLSDPEDVAKLIVELLTGGKENYYA